MKVVRVYKNTKDTGGDNFHWEDIEVEDDFELKECITCSEDWLFIGNSAFDKTYVVRVELRCQKQQESPGYAATNLTSAELETLTDGKIECTETN